jgi:hypothetical protein
MYDYFLLSRVLLRFDTPDEDIHGELSAAALTPDGSLWVGSDEMKAIERLSPIEPHIFGAHRSFAVDDYLDLFEDDDEIDIEGMDYADGYLWFTGSHSTKRKKTKDKKMEQAIERLSTLKAERNRYILGRIPVMGGELVKHYAASDDAEQVLEAACLQKTAEKNILIDALCEDEHLGPFLTFPLPSKENGFDIEGLAVRGNRVFLGFRGPVLRGWAIILEIAVEEREPGTLGLQPIGAEGAQYKKHFVYLNGLGIRELCWHNDDLLILAGPTMDLEGAMEIFRFHDVFDLEDDSLTYQEPGNLDMLFDLPFTIGSDHAEGMAIFPCLGQADALLVLYDSPDPARKPSAHSVFADVFLLRE